MWEGSFVERNGIQPRSDPAVKLELKGSREQNGWLQPRGRMQPVYHLTCRFHQNKLNVVLTLPSSPFIHSEDPILKK